MCKPGPSGHAGHSGHGGTGGHHPGGQTDLYKKPEEEGESDEEEDEDELEDDEAMTNLLPPTFPESLIFRISFNIIVKIYHQQNLHSLNSDKKCGHLLKHTIKIQYLGSITKISVF